jgi:hypothetical protein
MSNIKKCSKCGLTQRKGIISAFIPTLERTDLCASCLIDTYNNLDIENKKLVQILEQK